MAIMDMDGSVDMAEDLERFAEDSFIQAALHKGVDLRGYSKQIDEELRQVEIESVAGYVAQSEEVVDLHIQMQSCDSILKRMQEMLLGFQVFR
jgi:vacuolar protein sorting-associated protein 52